MTKKYSCFDKINYGKFKKDQKTILSIKWDLMCVEQEKYKK